MKNLKWVVMTFMLLMSLGITVQAYAANSVLLVPLEGTVGVQIEEFLRETLEKATPENYAVAILKLDTPGGLVESMRGIVQSILAAQVPVCVWVPSGGRAASAGAFIVQAAHVAAMAPGTNIGAAHPVTAGGEDVPGDMNQKVVNDLRAQMRSVVQLRGRNQDIAEQMINESLSLTAQEALSEGAIDIIADDLRSLLTALDGRSVTLQTGVAHIAIPASAQIVTLEMSLSEKIIQFLSSPEIAYMLLSGGMLALFFEVVTPGGFILGTLGAVMLLLGSIGLKMLPFSWAGVALLVTGAGLVVADLFAATSGILTLIGVPVFCVGGLFLFRTPGAELLRFSMVAVVNITVALVICTVILGWLVIRSLRRRVTTGQSGMVGLEAVVIDKIDVSGAIKSSENGEIWAQVLCHGEIWRAKLSASMCKGDKGIVTSTDGLTLLIEPVKPESNANVSERGDQK